MVHAFYEGAYRKFIKLLGFLKNSTKRKIEKKSDVNLFSFFIINVVLLLYLDGTCLYSITQQHEPWRAVSSIINAARNSITPGLFTSLREKKPVVAIAKPLLAFHILCPAGLLFSSFPLIRYSAIYLELGRFNQRIYISACFCHV